MGFDDAKREKMFSLSLSFLDVVAAASYPNAN
jgi:hypothetical protein